MTLFASAGPLIALLLAAALGARALLVAGGPDVKIRPQPLNLAIVLLAVLFVLGIAVRLALGL